MGSTLIRSGGRLVDVRGQSIKGVRKRPEYTPSYNDDDDDDDDEDDVVVPII